MSGTEGDGVSDRFVRENRQHVRTLVESLMTMGAASDREPVDAAFRAAHSLKANCELAGLDDAATVAHAVEDVLAAVRTGEVDLDEATTEEAMAAVEAIERVVDGATRGDPPAIEAAARVETLRARLDGVDADAEEDGSGGAAADGDDPAGASAVDLDDLELDGEARAALTAASDYDDLDALVAEMDDEADAYADLDGAGSFDAVEDGRDAVDGSDGDAAPGDPEPTDDRAPTAEGTPLDDPGADSEGDADGATGTPDTDSVDDGGDAPDLDVAPWTDLASPPARGAFTPTDGVAVPGAGRVTDAAATIDATGDDRFDPVPTPDRDADAAGALGGVRDLAAEGRRLTAALSDLDVDDDRVTDALASLRAATGTLDGVAAGSFRRLDAVVAELERAVGTAARTIETPVAFETDVAAVAVDRSVADRLADPLVHCVRNAVDHGIESPAERGAAGKPEAGTVTVRARRAGDRLVVSVGDDGRGVDADAVREAAVEAGHEDAADMPDDAVLDLLFEAGLSTADAGSDLSGRGVGMDVVGGAMADLGGEVTVHSTPGEGTTVRLAVPVEAVVERVLLVAVGPETYAVPAGAVRVVPDDEASVRGDRVRVQAGTERDAMGDATAFGAVREHPVVDLGAALDVPAAVEEGPASPERSAMDGPVHLLVAGDADGPDAAADDSRPALRCDAVLAEHEAPVTPLRGVATQPAVDGAVVCDAGRVVPTLDPGAFAGR